MDLYAENILDHSKNPRNAGLLSNATIQHGEVNLSCGDEIIVSLKLEDGIIRNIGWEGTGCTISQAAMSLLSEELARKKCDAVLQMKKEDMYGFLGIPIGPRRFKCALMGLHAVKNAIHKTRGEKEQSWLKTVGIGE